MRRLTFVSAGLKAACALSLAFLVIERRAILPTGATVDRAPFRVGIDPDPARDGGGAVITSLPDEATIGRDDRTGGTAAWLPPAAASPRPDPFDLLGRELRRGRGKNAASNR